MEPLKSRNLPEIQISRDTTPHYCDPRVDRQQRKSPTERLSTFESPTTEDRAIISYLRQFPTREIISYSRDNFLLLSRRLRSAYPRLPAGPLYLSPRPRLRIPPRHLYLLTQHEELSAFGSHNESPASEPCVTEEVLWGWEFGQ